MREGSDLSSQMLTEAVEASSNGLASVRTVVVLRKLDETTSIVVVPVVQTIRTHLPAGSTLLPPSLSECRIIEGLGRPVNAPASFKTHPHVRIYHTVVSLIPKSTSGKKCTDDTLICPGRA